MFRLLLRIGILAVMILALAIPKVDARAAPANAAALASQRRALLSARPPRNERRSLIEVATQGLFDLFGFEVGGRCRRAARPRSGSCTYRDSAIPRFRSSATFASVASTRRSPSRRPTLVRKMTDAPSRPPRPLQTASATYDPLCEFVNPMLDAENKLNCGGDYA